MRIPFFGIGASVAICMSGCAVAATISEERAEELSVTAAVEESSAVLTGELPNFTSVQADLFGVAGSLSNAWADYDNDGDLDFAVSIKGGEIRLYENRDGVFVDVGAALGMPESGDEIRGLSWGDYDGDGDVDLLGGSNVFPTPSRTYVYRNDGNGFVEVASDIGLTIPGRFSRQSSWVDYDNDGDLDLYAGSRAGPNFLFENDAGSFTMVGFRSGPTDPRRTVGACWFDIDRDGDLDVFVANQSGDSDGLWRNDGDAFVDIAPDLGMDQTLRPMSVGGVGCAVGDYDNDGDFDLYVATYGDNLLYRNNGDGSFAEVAKAVGVAEPDSTVGAAWADYDNDGDLDLMAVGYKRVDGVQEPLNLLFRNDGDRFSSVIEENHPMNVGDHGIEWIDYDADGDIDLSLTDGYGPEGGHFLLRNDLSEAARQRSLSVLVLDDEGHFTRAGSEVRLYDSEGQILASRQVGTGGGYNTQSATPVHFGLPNTDAVTMEVSFMGSGGVSVYRAENVLPGSETIVVRDEPVSD